MDTNRILYDYIVGEYGNVVNFSDKSGISLIDLNAVLLKDNVLKDICIGMNLCRILNIDVNEMIFNNQIKELEIRKNPPVSENSEYFEKLDEIAAKGEIYSKCIRLSEIEKKKVLAYIENISDKSRHSASL